MESILGYLLVLPWILIILRSGPVVGLKCYVCTSEDPGCDNNVNTTGTKYIKDCDHRAIGCINWFIQYEFVFPRFLTRSCAFGYLNNPGREAEVKCLIGDKEKKSYYFGDKDHGISNQSTNYYQVIECLKKNRVSEGLPPPTPIAMNAPAEFGMLVYYARAEELSNTIAVNGSHLEWGYPNANKNYKSFKRKTPDESELHCYSCDENVPTQGFGSVGVWQAGLSDTINEPLPQCEDTKRILCKKAYGCATIWEVRKEEEGTALSSRIWRGCWHPGDQFCLRRPISKHGNTSVPYSALGRNNEFESTKKWFFNKVCEEAYAESRTTRRGQTIQWAGTIVKETEALYNEYVQCRQDVRKRLGLDELKNVSREVFNMTDKPKGEDFFAAFRYIFCGFTEGCNLRENEKDPWKPPPGPTEPTPTPFPQPEEPGPETGLGDCTFKKDKSQSGSSTPTPCYFLAMISLYLSYLL